MRVFKIEITYFNSIVILRSSFTSAELVEDMIHWQREGSLCLSRSSSLYHQLLEDGFGDHLFDQN